MPPLPTIGETLSFAPRDNARMTLPVVHERCIATARIEFGDAISTLKLYPNDLLRVRAILPDQQHIIAFHSSKNHVLLNLQDTARPS